MYNPFFNPNTEQIEFPFQAIRDVIFVYQEEAPEKIGSFYLPEQFKSNHQSTVGVVLSVGPGAYIPKFKKWIPTTAKVGDLVLYDGGVPWSQKVKNWEGKEYDVKVFGERDLQGVIRQ